MLLRFDKKTAYAEIGLPGSKSISNRLLILRETLGTEFEIHNFSPSEDTRILSAALQQIKSGNDRCIDVGDAGTDFRFLTAFLCTRQGEWLLTGSDRMKERPVGPLVRALRELGAKIFFAKREGFPPLRITGGTLRGDSVTIESGVSSQFVSALMLVAPSLDKGLQIRLSGEPVSVPYIDMTAGILRQLGVCVQSSGAAIIVPAQQKPPVPDAYHVEADWTSASYWYSICSLLPDSSFLLKNLRSDSLQGDSVIRDIFDGMGVLTREAENGLFIQNVPFSRETFDYDFTGCPDLAQTLAVTCFAHGITANLRGLKTLRIKETDRIEALACELRKLGAKAITGPGSLQISGKAIPGSWHLKTYGDHRMAMAFSPLAATGAELDIENPSVVGKSFPAFWEELRKAGFSPGLSEI